MEENKTHSMRAKILDTIRTGEVHMRPRAYFMFEIAAIAVVSFFVLLFSVLICSYILFTIRASTATDLFKHGPPGWVIFVQFFPWLLLLLDILLIFLLEWMLRKFRFAYRSPVLYLLFGLLVVVVSLSVVLDRGRVPDRVLMHAHDTHVPGFEGLYDRGRRPPPAPPMP